MLKGKRVFISGGAGVIGRALVERLHNMNATIFVGDIKARPEDWPKEIKYRQGDLNYITKEELEQFSPEYFFHLAATFERSVETYEFWNENEQHNVRLGHHLMDCLKDNESLKKVIFASSYLIYNPDLYQFEQPAKKAVRLKETDPIYPRNLTGIAKLMHEIELRFLNSFSHVTFDAVCARIYRVYGKNSRDIISRWIRSLLKGEEITVYRKEGLFDYIYADEVAEGLIRLAMSDATGVVNLGNDNARRVEEVLNVLKTHFPNMTYREEESDILYEASQADMTNYQALTEWKPEKQLEDAIPELIAFEKNNPEVIEEEIKNVLITSVSKKVPLIKSVKKAIQKLGKEIKVYGGDLNQDCIGRYFVDAFWQMPRIDHLTKEDLIVYCQQNKIGFIIPTRDGELLYFAKLRKELIEHGIYVMVSEEKAVYSCLDKLLFYKQLKDFNYPVIATSENIDDLNADKFVVKEKFGAGANSLGLNLAKDEAIKHSHLLDKPIYQPYIEGKEVSVDLYIGFKGKVKGVVARTRDVVENGESQITTTLKNKELEDMCMDLVEDLELKGHVVLQVLIDHNGDFHIIECNSRFGGASRCSVEAGLDSFYWFLLESLGQNIDEYEFVRTKDEKQLVRFAEDIFIDALNG